MASDDEEDLSFPFRKRQHEDSDEEDDHLLGEPAPKRAKLAEAVREAPNVSHSHRHAAGDTNHDDIVLFQSGGAMVSEDGAEEAARPARRTDMDGVDTSGWSIADFIRKPVVGTEPLRKSSSASSGGGELASRHGATLPVVRSTSVRAAGAEPVAIETDPALRLYSDDPFAMQVMIGSDGRIIVDATTQVIPQAQEADTVHRTEVEGGSRHITSASYGKRLRTEKWRVEEVELLYEAISMCGTDFSMVEVFFPTRTRRHVKARFKKEEKENPTRVEAALRNRRPIDLEEFKRLIAIKKQTAAGGADAAESSSDTPTAGGSESTTTATMVQPTTTSSMAAEEDEAAPTKHSPDPHPPPPQEHRPHSPAQYPHTYTTTAETHPQGHSPPSSPPEQPLF